MTSLFGLTSLKIHQPWSSFGLWRPAFSSPLPSPNDKTQKSHSSWQLLRNTAKILDNINKNNNTFQSRSWSNLLDLWLDQALEIFQKKRLDERRFGVAIDRYFFRFQSLKRRLQRWVVSCKLSSIINSLCAAQRSKTTAELRNSERAREADLGQLERLGRSRRHEEEEQEDKERILPAVRGRRRRRRRRRWKKSLGMGLKISRQRRAQCALRSRALWMLALAASAALCSAKRRWRPTDRRHTSFLCFSSRLELGNRAAAAAKADGKAAAAAEIVPGARPSKAALDFLRFCAHRSTRDRWNDASC